jgi:two-component system OmpR family sensor kinase
VRPWRHWTVRARIVVSIAALAAVALIAADAVGMVELDSYLIKRVDTQLNLGTRGERFPLPETPLANDANRSSTFNPAPPFHVYRFDAQGNLVRGGVAGALDPDPTPLSQLQLHADGGRPYTLVSPSGSWRVRVYWLPNHSGFGVNAVSLRDVQDIQQNVLIINATVTAIVLLLMAAAAATVVRVGLRPLTRMEETATEIAGGGDLSGRVADADPHTESGRLGTALNTMLSRVEAAVAYSVESERRLRQFLADAAHELRTPLTSIQGFAELYRRGGAPPGPALDEAMSCIEAEVSRMRLLVNDLLTLARLDEERPLAQHPVDLLAVAADAVRDAHVRVPTRFVQLSGLDDYSATFEPVNVLGDEARLRQVAANLVSNALQHTPEDTQVVVRVGRLDESASPPQPPTATIGPELSLLRPVAAIEVSDTGPGMATLDAQRVFERLYRAEGSRSRRHGGAGLGLAIVAAIVQAHGGRVELWTAPQAGARFRVLLPAEPPILD